MSYPYGPPPQQPGSPQQPPGQVPPPYGQAPPPGYPPVVVPGARSYVTGSPAPYAVPIDPNAIGNYRGWAIFTIFVSLGTGIMALLRSREVDTYKAQGNIVLAKEASDSVRVLCLFALLPSLVIWAAIIVCIVVVVAS